MMRRRRLLYRLRPAPHRRRTGGAGLRLLTKFPGALTAAVVCLQSGAGGAGLYVNALILGGRFVEVVGSGIDQPDVLLGHEVAARTGKDIAGDDQVHGRLDFGCGQVIPGIFQGDGDVPAGLVAEYHAQALDGGCQPHPSFLLKLILLA